MSLLPFAAAPLAVQLHLLGAVLAFGLGGFLLASPKGTPTHRLTGRIWIALMLAAALSSFAIPATLVPLAGGFGIIHLLSAWVLVALGAALWAVRHGRIRAHRIWMTSLYAGALIGAGAGALVPGRLISHMLGYG